MAIEDLVKAAQEYDDQRLDLSLSAASRKSPEQSAKVYNLAKEKGLPFEYVERNYDRASRPDTSNVGPSVAQLLKDRRKAELSIDDIENLSWWETAGREAGNIGNLVPAAAKTISSAGYSVLGSSFNLLSELSLAPVRSLGLATEDEIKDGDVLGDVGKYMMEIAGEERARMESFMPKKTVLNKAVVGGIKSALINIPAMAAGVITRNPNIALGAMGGVTYGDSYLTAKKANMDELSAVTYAANQAIAEIVTERIPMKKLVGDIGAKTGFFKTVANQMAREIPGEQLATVWQDAINWAMINPEKTLADFIAARPGAAVDTLISTIVATGLQTSAIAGIDKLGKQKETADIQKIADMANESKLRQRAPGVFEEHIQNITEQYGSTDAVYLDAKEARALFQTMEKDTAYDLIAAQIDEAEAVGGDIVIPMPEFASKVATSNNFAALKDSFRLSAESPNLSQMAGQQQRVTDMLLEASKNVEIKTRADQIYQEVSKQLINSGRMNADVAKTSATIVPAYVTTMAARSGLPVEEIYGMMGLRVVGPDTKVTSASTLDQSDDGDTVTLYHGSPTKIASIENRGLFGGLFASGTEDAALSHGDVLHEVKLNKSEVLTQRDIEYEVDNAAVEQELKDTLFIESEEDLEIAREIAIQDKSAWNYDEDTVLRIFGVSDLGEASWEGQRVRGKLAKKLGYKAVEMNDEHGTSYLVLPGAGISVFDSAESVDNTVLNQSEIQGNEQRSSRAANAGQTNEPSTYARAASRDDTEALAEFERAKTGEPVTFTHRTRELFDNFNDATLGQNTTTPGASLGHYLSAMDVGNADRYGVDVVVAEFTLQNPLVIDAETFADTLADKTPAQVKQMRARFIEAGHDGVLVNGLNWAIVFEGSNLKTVADDAESELNALYQSPVDQTETEAFKNWFGDSKVVDESGKPLVVYHGTGKDISEFSKDTSGQGAGNTFGKGFYFTPRADNASSYAEYVGENGAPNVMPVYLRLQNPLVIDGVQGYRKFLMSEKERRGTSVVERDRLLSKSDTDLVTEAGHDGVVIMFKGEVNEIVAFNPEQIKSAIGNKGTFDPNDPSILNQSSKAEIYLLPNESIIKLGESSDLSSFLHELGHLFLDMEGRLFSHPNASPQMKADGQTILDWLGVESFDRLKNYATDPVAREAHEKFARGFEKYLGEGKAPTVELKSVFRRFSAWMKQVYRDLANLNVELTDDIRGVMDRLLATEDQISRAKAGFDPLFKSAEEAGMTQAEYTAYTQAASSDSGKEVLQAKMIKQLQRQYTKWWKDESVSLSAKFRKELLQNPLYSASEFLKGNHAIKGMDQAKLNRGEVKEQLGEVTPNFRNMTDDNGISADELAAIFGFASGFEMIDLIQSQPAFSQALKAMTEQEMVSRHGDILNDGTIQEEAEQAMRNPEQAKRLMAELNALSRKTKQPAIDREAIKAYAKETIGKMAFSKIRPAQYRSAEIRAAREAVNAKNKGDFAGAQKAKTQEVVNFYLSREATAAKEKAGKIRASQKAIQTRKYSASSIDTAYVNEAKVLLAAYDFRKNSDESKALADARLTSVRHWIESQQQNPESISTFVQADILGKLIPYSEMTLDDLTGLDDVVKSILHAGRKLAEENKAEYRANIDVGNESIKANRIESYETEIDSEIPWVRAKNLFDEATASMRKLESLARQADGMNDQGWVWRNTVKPLLDAANMKLKRQGKSSDELKEIFKGFNGAFSHMKDIRKFTTESGKSIRLSYGARLSLALNLGNDGNLEALKTMQALPLTDNDIANITSTLTERDWALIQAIWDYIDSYWPEIAQLEIKRSGVAPQKVLPRSFVTPSGIEMKGGYYPLAGDSAADIKQLEQDVDTMANAMMNGGASAKSTKHGSTIERVGFGGKKIDFSINVLFNHIDGILHDITHWQAVKDVDRVLKNEKINSELAVSLSKPGVKAMKQRLKEVAAGPQRLEGLGWVNRALRHARLASTYSALGYSVRTALMNTMGLTTAIADMSPKQISSGAIEYYSNLSEMNSFILSKSEYMRDRGLVLNRDIAYIRSHLRGDNAVTKFQENAFWMMTQTDKAITRPIWLAAYRDGEMKFDTEKEAIDHADRMVARTQGSGMDMDLANVETRSELMKTLTVMYTAFSAIYNISTEQIKRYKAGKISGVQLALKMSWLTVVPGILTTLLTGSDDDEPKDVLWEIAGQGLGMIPIARDAFSYARYGSSFPTPIVRLTIAPIKFVEQAAQGEVDKGLVGAGAELASWAHIPGGAQLTRTYGYLSNLQDGEIEEFSPIDLLITGKE